MRLHALQYLRAVAALAVVYSHAVIQVEDYQPYLPEGGSFGVDIFFVISGFIMIYIAKPDDTPGRFFMQRVRRVVPLYWFFTFLMAAILLLIPGAFKRTVFDLQALLASLAFIPYWSLPNPSEVWPIVAPGWSLNFEMYFYLIFAISLLFAPRFRIAFIAAVITTVYLIATNFDDGESAAASFFSLDIVFEFILGMLLAVAWKRGFRIPSSTAAWLLLTAVCVLLIKLPLPRIFEYGVPSLFIVMACLYIRVGEHSWLELLGDASYSLYLSHVFTLGILRLVLPRYLGDGEMAAYGFVLISLIVCSLVSIVIHKYVDNWLLRHERLTGGQRQTPVPSKA
ncbi:MAG: acyltransferase [Granulosicoccus sp.]|nr:acyltransferase [Granulosicoccus sp.]